MRISSRYTLLLGLPLAWLAAGCANPPQTASTPPQATQSEYAVSDARLRVLAQEFERRGQYDEAAGLYERSLQINPDQPDVRRKLQLLASRNRLHRKSSPGLTTPADTMLADNEAAGTHSDSAPIAQTSSVEPSTELASVTPASATETDEPTDARVETSRSGVAAKETANNAARPFPGQVVEATTTAAPTEPVAAEPTAGSTPQVTAEPVADAVPVITPARPARSNELPQIIAGPSTRQSAVRVAPPRTATAGRIVLDETLPSSTAAVTDSQAAEPAETVEAAPTEGVWKPTALTRLCKDAHAAVLDQVARLDSDDPAVRKDALTQLARMGHRASTASLAVRMLLNDTEPAVQGHAAWTLWCIDHDTRHSVPTLQTLLASDDPAIVQFACYVLGTMGADAAEATPALEQLIASATGATRVHAAEAAARIDGTNTAAIDVLIAALSDEAVETRWLAAIALSAASDATATRVVEALMAALADESADVRTAAALSLGGFGAAARAACASLETASEADDPMVRDAARTALACIAQAD